jgi:hypothetical protein
MRSVTVKVGTRTGRETLMLMRFGTEWEAKHIHRLMNQAWRESGASQGTYCVVAFCDRHGIELLFVIAPDDDVTGLSSQFVALCRQADLHVKTREMPYQDYEVHLAHAKATRLSQSN